MKPSHVITLENCKSYASEDTLDKALARLGLDNYSDGNRIPCRYIKCRNAEGRWTAIFLVTEFFRANNTGGYVGFASDYGFMSV
jgi:hypothetical protein